MGLALLAAHEFLGEESLHAMLTFNPGNFFTYVHANLMPYNCVSTLWYGIHRQELLQAADRYAFAICRFFLPPIIFSAGLSVRKKSFFRNFVSIASLGILGTYVALTFIVLSLLLYRKCFGFLTMQVCFAMLRNPLAHGTLRLFWHVQVVCVLRASARRYCICTRRHA